MASPADNPYVLSVTGHRMYVDPDDSRAQALRQANGTLSQGSSRLWQAILEMRAWDVVVDVGANYGEMLLSAELPAGARVICFEPNPQVLPFLRRSIVESGVDIDLREVAIGARSGTAEFLLDSVWSGRSGLAHTHRTDADHPVSSVVVPVHRLDSEVAVGEGLSVCVKVDVEGAEFDVLDGAHGLTHSGSQWAMMVEILHMDAFERAHLARTYTMRVMDRRSGDLVTVPPASPHWVASLLEAGWLYPQDAVLTSREAA